MTTESNAGVPPALSADEWFSRAHGSAPFGNKWMNQNADGVVFSQAWSGDRLRVSKDELPALLALANDALPTDSPHKIARADAEHLIYMADVCDLSQINGANELRDLAGKLTALLRPV